MVQDKKDPAISVVMSVFNAENYLDEAITSILTQTFNNFEFIIIDDGSTDGTRKIIQKYAHKDSRIIVLTQKNNGLINSLNTGFALSRGKYIARMDADDISESTRLQTQYDYFENNSDLVLLGSLVAYIDEKGIVTGIWPFLYNDEEIRTGMVSHAQYCHGAVMIRQSIVKNSHELYDPKAKHYEDYEYWPRLLAYGTGANLPKVLYYYRLSDNSITSTKKLEMEEGSQRIRIREANKIYAKPFRIKECIEAIRTSRIYNLSHIVLNGQKFPTHLQNNFLSYLIGKANMYATKHDYLSIICILSCCIFINPLQTIKLTKHKIRNAAQVNS